MIDPAYSRYPNEASVAVAKSCDPSQLHLRIARRAMAVAKKAIPDRRSSKSRSWLMMVAFQATSAMRITPTGRPIQIRARIAPPKNEPTVVAALRAPKKNAA